MREIKRYERGFENGEKQTENTLRLVGYNVYFDKSEILLDVSEFSEENFNELFDVKTGSWCVKDGWVSGENPDMCPGMIVSKDDYFGYVMVEIRARMVAPSTHDINLMINGEWIDEKGGRGYSYVAGAEAFWHGNIGFEKTPEYKLTAATNLFDFDPEKEHIIRFGNVRGKVFFMVDGELCLEVTDPDPIDVSKYGKIGFEAFSSKWEFKDLKVYKLNWEWTGEYYVKEF